MNNESEASPGPAAKSEKASLELVNSESLWKDRASTFIETLAQIDDISWASISKQTGNQEALDFARLGPEGRKQKFYSVPAKARDEK